jgi:hypothetical protein
MHNPVTRIIICDNPWCRNRVELNDDEVALNTHPEDMKNCPSCGRKCRHSARDKRRANRRKS